MHQDLACFTFYHVIIASMHGLDLSIGMPDNYKSCSSYIAYNIKHLNHNQLFILYNWKEIIYKQASLNGYMGEGVFLNWKL